jgi:hypothetical protein
MKALPRNVTPFTLEGWPLDALDQETMVELRKLADQSGWTLAEVMREVTEEYVARRKAEKELETKVIKFPKVNPHLRSPAA